MADRSYAGFYERARQKYGTNVADMSTEQLVREFQDAVTPQDDGYDDLAAEIAQQQKDQDLEQFGSRNVVETENKADIPDEAARRLTDFGETLVQTSEGEISIDKISGTFENNGTTFVMVDGKIYGKLED